MPTSPLLSVSDLTVEFRRDDGFHPAVQGVSFEVERGKTLGIVGESGSGKTVSTLALMGLLPKAQTRITSGHALFTCKHNESDDRPTTTDLLTLSEADMQHVRGRHISMIFQEPMTSLNPVQRCGAQVAEMLQLHSALPQSEVRSRVLSLLDEVRLPNPERVYRAYPHELSGGQKQRVMIAMALMCHPDLIVADEPTTALDVTVQRSILELLQQMQERYGMSMIFISHDLGVISQVAHTVAVMYRGRIVEQGEVSSILHAPREAYTQGLIACRPPLDSRPRRLPTVDDFLRNAEASSTEVPLETNDERTARLHALQQQKPLLSVRNLSVDYVAKRNLFGRPTRRFTAVDDISFDVFPGETLGLVGESGCGKTTLGRTLLRLIEARSGSITFDGTPIDQLSEHTFRRLRPSLQIVFQDPYSSLNPRKPIGETIREPLTVHQRELSKAEGRARVVQLMQRVGLDPEWYNRYPHEFSGGQRQRVCIARALIMNPRLVICDESVSALDVSVQAQVLNLLAELKQSFGYTYVFISHDLSVVRFVSDRIMVMRNGRIVEQGEADSLFANPQQPYTRSLIDALPHIG
ncbi:MAG: ABC transporter ATP-binding protein [Bacteroidales bacterium]|nr:ABC transporter ATP-binding protein [Bacteroidales bacterium]